jgi:hypothetical protein
MAAANTSPAFTRAANKGSVNITAGNTSSAGGGTIGTDIFLLFTADTNNGSFIPAVSFIPTASVAATATTATVARIFVSSQSSGATTTANTELRKEIALPSVTAASSTVAVYPIDIPLGIWLKAGQSLLVTNHVAPATNTAWRANVDAGDY